MIRATLSTLIILMYVSPVMYPYFINFWTHHNVGLYNVAFYVTIMSYILGFLAVLQVVVAACLSFIYAEIYKE